MSLKGEVRTIRSSLPLNPIQKYNKNIDIMKLKLRNSVNRHEKS